MRKYLGRFVSEKTEANVDRHVPGWMDMGGGLGLLLRINICMYIYIAEIRRHGYPSREYVDHC